MSFVDNFKEPLKITQNGVRLPEFKMSEGEMKEHNIPENSSNLEILTALCRNGYTKKKEKGLIPKEKEKEYGERVKRELSVLDKLNFTDYILSIFDITNNAHNVGPGRGSAAGSLVNDLIGITTIDPIPYDLYFERFISENRAKTVTIDGVNYLQGSLPDIDLDFGDEDREEIIKYLGQKYPGKFVKLCTFQTLSTKVLTKELGKTVKGYHEDQVKFVSDSVPVRFGKNDAVEEAYENSEVYKRFCEENPLIFTISKRLESAIKNVSSHASAYLISYDPLDESMPVQLGTKGEVVSCYNMDSVETAIKVDLLGVQSLNLFNNVAKLVGINLEDIDINDYDTIYKYLQELLFPYGLFQISGESVVRALNKIKPNNIFDLAVVTSIARPGAFAFIDQLADFRNGVLERPNTHALFNDILEKTGFICVFQEQLMQMFVKIGFSLSEADDIRRIVGKKKEDEIDAWEAKIYERGRENGIDVEACKQVWEIAKASASYSFNASHAFAYSKTSAISVYLKFKYPKEFFYEALKMSQNGQDPLGEIAEIKKELPFFGIELLPPDIIHSQEDFSIEGNNIRFGIGNIKKIAQKLIDSHAIDKVRETIDKTAYNKFRVFHVAKQAKMNIGALCVLILSGCLNSLDENRTKMALEAQIWYKLNTREWNYLIINGTKYNHEVITALKDYVNWNDGKAFKESRLETIRKACKTYFDIYKKNLEYPEFSNYCYEKGLLGYSYSTTLKSIFKKHENLLTVQEAKDCIEGKNVCVAAEITELKKGKTKKLENKIEMWLSDESGTIKTMLKGDKLDRYLSNGKEPVEGDLVYVQAGLGKDILWINRLEILELDVAFSARDLKKQFKTKKSDEEANLEIVEEVKNEG